MNNIAKIPKESGAYIRQRVSQNPSTVDPSVSTALEGAQLAFHKDSQRLSTALNLKSHYRIKYEQVLFQIKDLELAVNQLTEAEQFYIKENNNLKNEVREIDFLREEAREAESLRKKITEVSQKQDQLSLYRNLEKI